MKRVQVATMNDPYRPPESATSNPESQVHRTTRPDSGRMARVVWFVTIAWISLSVFTSFLILWFSSWTLLHMFTPLLYLCLAAFWGSAVVVPLVLLMSLWITASGRMSVKSLGGLILVNLLTVALHVGVMFVENARYQ